MAKATILVVDDESLIRWSLSERLKSEAFNTEFRKRVLEPRAGPLAGRLR